MYDPTDSRYVSFEDLQRMVTLGIDLVVIDQVTGGDITRPVLLQVVAASEQGSAGVLSREFMLQVILSQEDDSPSVAASYLEQGFKLFWGERRGGDCGSNAEEAPAGDVARRLAQKHHRLWCMVEDQICQKLRSCSTGLLDLRV
jgi:polyhydroxyalkanoate synthesis repressor PhaR